jgi:thiol:disulfide interchange protein DsbA
MKKLWLAMATLVTFGVAGCVQATDFEEGVHYEVVSDEASDGTEIIDFFSFYCNACYQFQPFSQMLKDEYGDDFKKYQVQFIAAQGMGDTIVQAWATAVVLDVTDEVAPAIFRQHFAQRQMSSSLGDLEDIFASVGVDRDEFEKAYNSFPVRSLANRMKREAETYNVRATPTYIINGRYRMKSEAFRDSRNFFEDYFELAKYLVEKDK